MPPALAPGKGGAIVMGGGNGTLPALQVQAPLQTPRSQQSMAGISITTPSDRKGN